MKFILLLKFLLLFVSNIFFADSCSGSYLNSTTDSLPCYLYCCSSCCHDIIPYLKKIEENKEGNKQEEIKNNIKNLNEQEENNQEEEKHEEEDDGDHEIENKEYLEGLLKYEYDEIFSHLKQLKYDIFVDDNNNKGYVKRQNVYYLECPYELMSEKEDRKIVGKGSYGEVFKVINKKTGKVYALKKIVLKKDCSKNSFVDEVKILIDILSVKEKYFLKVIDIFSVGYHKDVYWLNYQDEIKKLEGDVYYIITEFYEKGELFYNIENNCFNENQKNKIAYQLINAIKILNDKSIAHVDLKLENIFIDAYDNIKIGDFGMSVKIKQKEKEECIIMNGNMNHMSPIKYLINVLDDLYEEYEKKKYKLKNIYEEYQGKYKYNIFKDQIYVLGMLLYEIFYCCDEIISENFIRNLIKKIKEMVKKNKGLDNIKNYFFDSINKKVKSVLEKEVKVQDNDFYKLLIGILESYEEKRFTFDKILSSEYYLKLSKNIKTY